MCLTNILIPKKKSRKKENIQNQDKTEHLSMTVRNRELLTSQRTRIETSHQMITEKNTQTISSNDRSHVCQQKIVRDITDRRTFDYRLVNALHHCMCVCVYTDSTGSHNSFVHKPFSPRWLFHLGRLVIILLAHTLGTCVSPRSQFGFSFARRKGREEKIYEGIETKGNPA